MKKYYYTIIAILFASVFTVTAQIPSGYYDGTDGKIGDELKEALNEIIKDHTEKSYGEARYILEQADLAVGSTDSLRSLYTYHKVKAEWDAGVTWNREHVWSKSRGFDVEVSNSHRGVGSDIHNLRACIPSINSAKSNRWFAECDEPYYYGDDFTGTYINTQGSDRNWLWEPRDEDKGDVARIIFYMATRYEGEGDEVDLEVVDYIPGDKYTTSPIYALLTDLMRWHLEDPVDQFEINRNNKIYQSQNNRNPFIDRPEFAALVFDTYFSDITTLPEIPFAGTEVGVKANAYSSNAIMSVSLKWGVNENNLDNTITMSLESGSTYITDENIPAQNSGSVYFVLESFDEQMVTKVSEIQSYVISSGVVLFEDFETVSSNEAIALEGWSNFNELGDKQWIGKSSDDNKYAQFSSYNSGGDNAGWLITPSVNLNNTANEIFSFEVNVGYWKHDALSVFISIDYDGESVLDATWEDVSDSFVIPQEPTDGYGAFISAGDYDLSNYNGNVNIAFKYEGTDPGETTTLQIDNVFVGGDETSIAKKQSVRLALYPNPANNLLNFGKEFVEAKVKIYNVLGVELGDFNLSGSSISVSDLANGQYLIQIVEADQIYLEHFVILK